ncbi:Xyloglucan-specific Endo-beta-1 4-glucanase BoGH9A, partial [termite gut metagenome]
MNYRFLTLSFLTVTALLGCSQSTLPVTDLIRLNQLGYFPSEEKIAVADTAVTDNFQIRDVVSGKVVYRGVSSGIRPSAISDKQRTIIEFSKVQAPGAYVIELTGVGQSYPFEIKESLLRPLAVAAVKAF